MSKSNYLENALLDHQMGGPDYVRPATLYFGLFTTAPTDAGGGVEVSGGNYSRSAVTNNATNFPAASGGDKSNGTAVAFPTPSAGWGLVTHFASFDAPTGGNMLRWGPLTIPKTINQGDLVNFPPGSLDCSED